jgi:hypothetical protein
VEEKEVDNTRSFVLIKRTKKRERRERKKEEKLVTGAVELRAKRCGDDHVG